MLFNDICGNLYVIYGIGSEILYIDPKYFNTNTVHRNIISPNTNQNESILSCGFLTKNKNYKQTSFLYEYYVGFYVLSGTGMYIDNKGKKYKLFPGSFVQRFPGQEHSTFVDEDSNWLEFFIDFGRSSFQNMVDIGIFDNENPVLYIGESQMVFTELNNYLENLRLSKDDDLPYMLLEAERILCSINQMSRNYKNDNTTFTSKACKKIKDNVSVGTNIKDIAESLGFGYESFRKKFTKEVGLSPCEYMLTERINLAKTMLLDQGMPIKNVAITLGYTDVFAFINQFKKHTGITPGEFIRR